MSMGTSNPELLALALDAHLDHEVRLVVYGRSAIALGFDNPPVATQETLDIDAIISLDQLGELEQDDQFWDAKDAVNEELKDKGSCATTGNPKSSRSTDRRLAFSNCSGPPPSI